MKKYEVVKIVIRQVWQTDSKKEAFRVAKESSETTGTGRSTFYFGVVDRTGKQTSFYNGKKV